MVEEYGRGMVLLYHIFSILSDFCFEEPTDMMSTRA